MASEQAEILWRGDVVEDSELDPQPGVGWGVGFGFGHRHSGIGLRFWDPAPVKEIKHYRLVLEAVDAVTGRVIWHAESRERLLRDATPAERTAQVDRLVATLLQKWPPVPSAVH
ncbi:MAG: hypothetical protein D6758_01610 [Gammaproteobacteria bacterium]|nr:MAG: hypothetical protein D6758_01610 [Gammaproteobacteria bacterium]